MPTVTSAVPEKIGGRTHSEIKYIMTALMIAMLLAALDQSIVATALPRIASDLHGLTKLSWVATSYLITSAIVTPIYGKLGDMFGRKKIFQIAIGIFLVGSALAGLSQSMNQLVFFRALQGVGAGGLMSLVLAIIGDVIPPRYRGRYQGYFGAVFGLSSIGGPVLGGLFTEHLSWRWIFYINLPLGALALYLVATRLQLPVKTHKHRVDYAGASLLSLSVLSLILMSVWAGVDYAWGSAQIIGLAISTIVFGVLFIWRERWAAEPIIPLGLFKNDIMAVSTLLSFITGIAMFASILYIPLYQQVVRGLSPTKSGLLMLPMVLGMFLASMGSGQIITRTGRYRIFPIIGTLLMATGLWLFSHLGLTTSYVLLSLWMLVIGLGLGQLFQVPTLAVQNSTDRANLGTATSTVTFFRSIGGALGGAVFGSILISRLTHHLQQALPDGTASKVSGGLSSGLGQLAHLPAAIRHSVLTAYVQSFREMFLIAVPIALLAFLVSLKLREAPLRDSHEPHLPE